MKDLLCDISAFRYWRLPPQVRALCPPLPRPEEDRQRYDLARNPTAAVALGFPLYTLVRTRNKRTCPASIRQRLFLGEPPRESVLETEHEFFDYVSSTDGIHHVAASDGSSASFCVGGDVRPVCGVCSAGGTRGGAFTCN